jgi:hypothetical protein
MMANNSNNINLHNYLGHKNRSWYTVWRWKFRYINVVVLNRSISVITKLPNSEQFYKGKVKTHKYINRPNQSTTGKLWKNRNDPDLVQAFLKKWWVESDFKAPNLPLSLRPIPSLLVIRSPTIIHIHKQRI